MAFATEERVPVPLALVLGCGDASRLRRAGVCVCSAREAMELTESVASPSCPSVH
jgi:hypothetical protein